MVKDQEQHCYLICPSHPLPRNHFLCRSLTGKDPAEPSEKPSSMPTSPTVPCSLCSSVCHLVPESGQPRTSFLWSLGPHCLWILQMSYFLKSHGVACPYSQPCVSEGGPAAEHSALLAPGDFCVLCGGAAGSPGRAGSDVEHPECQDQAEAPLCGFGSLSP